MAVTKQSFTRENEDPNPYPRDEEAEETLSLSDLPIYGHESNSDHYFNQPDRSDLFDNDDTFFEFFNHDFSVSDSAYARSDNIIFCGKLIPYKQPIDSQNTRIESEKISARNCQFRTKSHSFDARDREIACTRTKRGVKSFDSLSLPENPECMNPKRSRKLEKFGVAAERAIMLRSSPTKSLWFLFLFGSAGCPKEMELSDMRTRQRRSSRPAMFRPAEERKAGGKKRRVHGMWKIVRAMVMGCTNSHRNVAVKGSFKPITVV